MPRSFSIIVPGVPAKPTVNATVEGTPVIEIIEDRLPSSPKTP
jgi:hypothetical protein